MFRGRKEVAEGQERTRQPLWLIATEGLFVGVLTGLVGVGGGFLIVPALVLLGGLSMRLAVGTSLLIIAAKSAAGFFKYTDVLADAGQHVDWGLIGIFAAIGIVGSFVGNALSQRVPQAQLKRGFAVFLVVMGGFILFREGPKALGMPSNDIASAPAVELPAPSADPIQLTPAQAAVLLADTPDAIVVDVRTPIEIAATGALRDARHIAYGPGFTDRAVAALDAERPVVLYCASGGRSARAAQSLADAGFGRVYNAGGFGALQSAGLPTE